MDNNLSLEQERIFIIGLQQQQRKLQQLLAQIAHPEVWDYLDEAARCFGAGAYNAAVVMGWSAVTCYYRLVARLNYDLFAYCFWAQHDKHIGDPKQMKDWELIQACERMEMLSDIRGQLDDFQAKRNSCAHPSHVPLNPLEPVGAQSNAQPSEVVALLERAVRLVLARQASDERLYGAKGAGIVMEFLSSQETHLEAAQVTRLLDLLDDGQYRYLAHRLREAFQRVDEPPTANRNFLLAWKCLWTRIDEMIAREQLRRIADEMAGSVRCRIVDTGDGMHLVELNDSDKGEDREKRKPRDAVELEKMLPWPPLDPDSQLWDVICDCLIRSLEQAVKTDSEVNPIPLLRRLKEYAPSAYKERIVAVRDLI